MKQALLVLALLCALTQAFSILPGVEPNEYAADSVLNIKVNGLASVKAQIPYEYYYLPFPKPEKTEHKKETLGEMFTSTHIENSLYNVKVLQDESCIVIGDVTYNQQQSELFSELISDEYVGNLLLDNLPVSMKIVSESNVFYEHGYPLGGNIIQSKDSTILGKAINNHLDFTILYHSTQNGKVQIVGFEVSPKSINHQSDPDFSEDGVQSHKLSTCNKQNAIQPIFGETEAKDDNNNQHRVIFTYSYKWQESPITWSSRFDNYLNHDPSRQNNKVHWFSIINSLLIVVFLTGMVGLILLRTLYQDFARYNRLAVDEDIEADREDSGWKMLHADVFRPPEKNPTLLCATTGFGLQVFLTVFISLLFALCGFASPEKRGTLGTIVIITYLVMGYFSGYLSSRFYKTFNGKNFKKNFFLTTFFYPGIMFMILFFMNIIFYYEESTGYIPFSNVFTFFALFVTINLPLTFYGAYKGFKKEPYEAPVATSGIPRELPPQPWYLSTGVLYIIGGIVPFGVIFVELYFFLSSIWMGHYYYLFGFLFLVIFILTVSTAEISIVITYSLLCAENYHWWWYSVLSPGFSSVYIFFFSIYYFFTSFKMSTLSAIILCIGYMSILSLIFFVFTGFIGFISSYLFVMAIFGAVKVD